MKVYLNDFRVLVFSFYVFIQMVHSGIYIYISHKYIYIYHINIYIYIFIYIYIYTVYINTYKYDILVSRRVHWL